MTSKVLKITFADQEILVDRKDLKGIDLFNLRINVDGYVSVGERLLHRIITNCPDNMQVDHINKNRLDNRRCNLRICTNSQNQMNRGQTKANSTGHKGVNCEKRNKRKKYRARITADKKTHYLGNFEKATDAGKAYREAVKIYHGKFSRIKDPKKK